MMGKKMRGYKYLLLMVILFLFTTSISVSATAPVLVDSSIDVRTGGVYIFAGSEFDGDSWVSGSVDDIVIDAVPTAGLLEYTNEQGTSTVTVGQTIAFGDIYGAACLTYIPSGTGSQDSFSWHANNFQAESSNTVTMNINIAEDVNHAPATQLSYSYRVLPLTSITGSIYVRDIDNDDITYSITKQPSAVYGAFSWVNQTNGDWQYTSTSKTTGSTTFNITVSDGVDSAISYVTVNADNLTITPDVSNVTMQSAASPRSISGDITASLSQGNSNKRSYPIVASHGTVTITDVSLALINTWTYTPEPSYVGTDTFTITIYNANAPTTIVKTATVNVYVNDTLTIPNYSVNTPTNTQVGGTVVVSGNGDGDAVTCSKHTSPTNGTATVNSDGTWSYAPVNGFTGEDSFTVTASDQHGGTTTSTITVTTIGEFTIDFDSVGGSAVASVTRDTGTKIAVPTAPTKAKNVFGGWYKEADYSTPWDFNNDVVTGNTTLYAKWILNTYSITTNITGSGTVTPLNPTVNEDGTSTFAITPAEGYEITLLTFNGVPVVLTNGEYTTPAITENSTLNVTFTIKALIPPTIITGVPENKSNLNLHVRNKSNNWEDKLFLKSSLSYATILNPDNFTLVSYGMYLRDSQGKWVDLPVLSNAFSGQFAVHVFGQGVEGNIGFVSGQTYTLQAYLKYIDEDGITTKITFGEEKPFTWQ